MVDQLYQRPRRAGLSYGPDLEDIVRRAAPYVDRILHGENPADLPVQVPTKFQLVVNLKTAKALGLTISRDFLLVADEVIEEDPFCCDALSPEMAHHDRYWA
jgi:ABC-type uncharacterized transport system substrate-binding protein